MHTIAVIHNRNMYTAQRTTAILVTISAPLREKLLRANKQSFVQTKTMWAAQFRYSLFKFITKLAISIG